MQHPNGRTTTVVLDPEIGPGLMSDIMNELNLTRAEFLELLQDPKKWRIKEERTTD